ncbi:NAD(P)H-quinone oxidoreductase subunit 5 [Synechococcus sp. PCC 7336]|uniref:NAD(P)H-quinone oxidoreductase subunit 5 n=1 Tax=Synechococcus sp. PCC 7336 TaxID=195250 RepID=UPI0003455F29|nr:NAD(P)H-quinone oxidoreductase subunit 5 [Synechococcus sp. PCC 7336]
MELAYQYVWLIPIYPLFAAVAVGIAILAANRWIRSIRKVASGFSVFAIGTAMVHAIAILVDQVRGGTSFYQSFVWGQAGDFVLRMGFTVDHLVAMMLVVVATVAFLVMVYTDGYMEHDEGYVRFYAYLSLFSFSMLGLVLSPNLLQIYVFWELVGMCSYLLIGFWYNRPAAAEAAQKAFVTNRVGDFGLLLGMLGLYWISHTFEFEAMGRAVETAVESGAVSIGLVSLFAVLVFLGPVAKSAQFPLHVWLPDAMEGPTPISALIHAATMVAAGIFLVARMFPVFEGVPIAMQTIAWVGAVTAFLGASIALTQNDIKKGLAYSTMSQLGYMMMAMGVGAYGAGLFHLTTHAYFKAMLFLCSGSVIHGMEGVVGHNPVVAQDMRVMGGLRKYMPFTAITFLVGTLAICGIPPFAGFWSKDEILGSTFAVNPALWAIGFITAGLTAFYMFRMYFLTFEGEFRGNDAKLCAQVARSGGAPVPAYSPAFAAGFGPGAMNTEELEATQEYSDRHSDDGDRHGHASEPHESPWTMTIPLLTLAIPSISIGLLGTPFANFFEAFIHPPSEVVEGTAIALGLEEWADVAAGQFEWSEFLLMGGSSVGIGLIGIALAVLMYRQKAIDPAAIAAKFKPLYLLSLKKWYFDEIYDTVFVKGTRLAAREALEVDQRIVDGVVNFAGLVTLISGETLKYFESGKAQFYALVVFASAIAIVVFSGAGLI